MKAQSVSPSGQVGTTRRYRCQVAWPSTGTTTARPTNRGIEPTASNSATISPQVAIATGFFATALTEVWIATAAPTSRSSSRGKEMTLMTSVTSAKRNPIRFPTIS